MCLACKPARRHVYLQQAGAGMADPHGPWASSGGQASKWRLAADPESMRCVHLGVLRIRATAGSCGHVVMLGVGARAPTSAHLRRRSGGDGEGGDSDDASDKPDDEIEEEVDGLDYIPIRILPILSESEHTTGCPGRVFVLLLYC